MKFDKLNYKQKIAIAKLFFRENFYKGNNLDFTPKDVYINWGKFEFYGRSFGCIEVKTERVKNFFENNNQIIRKEKLLEIRKNLS